MYIPYPGKLPFIVGPLVAGTYLSRVILDGVSGINVLYANTLDAMGIPLLEVRTGAEPFMGIIPGCRVLPLGLITLDITFGDTDNFQSERLTFTVVDQDSAYHALLGRLFFVKFMVVCSYVYLKVKIKGPHGVINVSSEFSCAFDCDRESMDMGVSLVALGEFKEIKSNLEEDRPQSKNSKSPASFQMSRDSKAVSLNHNDLEKKVLLGTSLEEELEATYRV